MFLRVVVRKGSVRLELKTMVTVTVAVPTSLDLPDVTLIRQSVVGNRNILFKNVKVYLQSYACEFFIFHLNQNIQS